MFFLLTFVQKSGKIRIYQLMADVAQLVRALVCGTRCREFESHLPPHFTLDRQIAILFLFV